MAVRNAVIGSANQRVVGSIPSLEHKPGLQARSPVGGAEGT